MTSEIAFLKIRLLPSQGKFRTRLELMAAVNTMETLKELSIEISVVRMELIKQNLVIISFKKHKLGSALGDPFNWLHRGLNFNELISVLNIVTYMEYLTFVLFC